MKEMQETIALLNAKVPHLILTVLLAAVIASVAALLGRRSRRQRMYHAGYLLVCSVASVVAGSWIMYLIHG
jgi:hypothetical protein